MKPANRPASHLPSSPCAYSVGLTSKSTERAFTP